MFLSELFRESKYAENGKNYLVIVKGRNQRDYHKLKCLVCNDECFVTAASVLSGRKPCLCSKKSATTEEKKMDRLIPVLQKNNMTLVSDTIGRAKDPITVHCNNCNNDSNVSYNSLVLKGTGCKYCANNLRPSKQDLWYKAELIGKDSNFSVIDIEYLDSLKISEIDFKLRCELCDQSWTTHYRSIAKGCSCPSCAVSGFNPTKPAKLYILRVSKNDILIGYKYGISCDVDRRIYEHTRDCKELEISFNLSWVWSYSNGTVALNHEKNIKHRFKPFFKQWELPSGFTESVSISDLSELVDFQTNQYKESLWLTSD